MNNKNELVEIVAKNIAHYRKQLNMTQLDLAEKLNYSDKSVSKWERAEGMPDVYVLKELSDFFGVGLDDLVREHKFKPIAKKKKDLISFFYASLPWVVAAFVFALLSLLGIEGRWWLFFIGAIPASALTLYIFNTVWRRIVFIFVYQTIFIWSLSVLVFLLVNQPAAYYIFIATVPIYLFVMLLLFMIYKKR